MDMTFKICPMFLFIPLLLFAENLSDVFQNPPEDAKPRGYWVWPHGNFDYQTIQNELREFKTKGFGGLDIFDLGIRDNKDVIPSGPAFMSPEQVDGISFALEEAKELDLKMGLIVSSSWNAGASWTPPEFAAMNLVASRDTVQGPLHYENVLPFPILPDSFSKPYGVFPLHVPKGDDGLPEFYLDVATLMYPLDPSGKIQNPDQVLVFEGPELKTDIPPGEWIVLRTICTNFGQKLWVPSDNSNGLSIDHFSREAVTDHFKTIISRLENRCGPLRETALERLYLASYESNAEIIWTPALSDEFRKRNGYAVESWLPVLFGMVIQDAETTERFLYDFRKTVSDLFVDNLYDNAREICHQYGLKICSEAGGPGAPLHDVPTEDLKALGALDVMRGEFWVDKRHRLKPDGFEELQIVKSIASAAHTYGHKIVEMEAFTSHDNWRQSPARLKPFADRAFCEGMNRIVYHTMSHNLPEAGRPGWSFGAGTHINTNLTWWDMSEAWHGYLTRCSALLQQGQFVADVCYYYGHEIPNFAQPKHVRPGLGYDYDDINTEVLLTAGVENGRLTLPGGMSYAVLVLPDDKRMDLAVAKKIEELLQAGATIIGPKPVRVYGLAHYQNQESELRSIAARLWGRGNPKRRDVRIGKGQLVTGKTVRDVLGGIGPDFECLNAPADTTLDFIHRRSGEDEIYFVRNTTDTPVTIDVRFRVFDKQPALWNPATGDVQQCGLFRQEKTGLRMPLYLEAMGSVFVIFQETNEDFVQEPHIVFVKSNGKRLFPGGNAASVSRKLKAVKTGRDLILEGSPGDYELIFSDGQKKSITLKEEEMAVEGPWDVRFPHGWEAKQLQTFAKLISWTESEDAGTRAFSGIATYRKTFTLSKDRSEEENWKLDIGEVKEIARVYVNGVDLGISCFAPHTFDVTGIVRSGDNHLVVRVANTWLNRLIEDDKRPESERLTHTNLTRGPTANTAWREATPRPSGLLGPVRFFKSEVSIQFE